MVARAGELSRAVPVDPPIRLADVPPHQADALLDLDGDVRGVPIAEKKRLLEAYNGVMRSEEHTSELQSQSNLVCRLLLENKIYLECAEKLVPGNVVGVRGKLDLRDESLRATAEKLRLLSLEVPRVPNLNRVETPPLCLHFSANAGSDELREVQSLLAASPGHRPVQLIFETAEGETLRVDAGAAFQASVTAELGEQLQRWLITAGGGPGRGAGEREGTGGAAAAA